MSVNENMIFICNGCSKLHLTYKLAIFQRQFMGYEDEKFKFFPNGTPENQLIFLGDWNRFPIVRS